MDMLTYVRIEDLSEKKLCHIHPAFDTYKMSLNDGDNERQLIDCAIDYPGLHIPRLFSFTDWYQTPTLNSLLGIVDD
jgi:hypothetical protein